MQIYLKTWLIPTFLVLVTALQAQNCDRPIIEAVFTEAYTGLKDLKYEQAQSIQYYVSHNCLNVKQIQKLTKLFPYENRYDFLAYAYDFVYNEEKYGLLSETLVYEDERKAFDELLAVRRKMAADSAIDPYYDFEEDKIVVEVEKPKDEFLEVYQGPLGCLTPITEIEYLEIKKEINLKTFDDAKIKTAKKLLKGSCLKSKQIIGLASSFELESNRMKLAKLTWPQTYDLGNFFKVSDLFEFEMSADNLRYFMEKNPLEGQGTIKGTYPIKEETFSSGKNTAINCESPMSNEDFQDARRLIRKQNFSDTRMKMAKQIAEGNCMSTQQIKDTMLLLEAENDRLNFAKFAFDYAWDQANYSLVKAALYEDVSVAELNSYLKTRN